MSDVTALPKFGKRLKRRRERMKLTLTEVAKNAGINLATLGNIEAGEYLASLPVYRQLCRVLKLSPGKLLGK